MAAGAWDRKAMHQKSAVWMGGVSACLIAGMFFAERASASILPPNNLHLQDNLNLIANISEQDFNTIIDNVINYYKPLVAAKGATLKSNNLWTDATVNASAQQIGNTWVVNMYGGLARRPEVTPDGFAMVVCHELGHHLGGFPFYGDKDWAASEGQSDYFATQSCAREIWRGQTAENATYRSLVGEFEKKKCDSSWSKTEDQDLCYRTSAAGLSLATLLGALRSGSTPPRFNTPDPRKVSSTYTAHPEAQCRLDTYFSGALCPVTFDKNIIPGRNTSGGQISLDAELKASAASCTTAAGYAGGVRPLCWFKPKLEFLAIQYADVRYQEQAGNNNGVIEPGEVISAVYKISNLAVKSTTNIQGELLGSSDKLQIIEGQTQFDDLGSGQAVEARTPVVFKVTSAAKCGDKIPLTLKAKSDQGSVELTREIRLGRLVSTDVGSVATQINIPDNDLAGIESTFDSQNTGSASALSVRLDVDHPYVRDLRISLISPEGKEYKIYPTPVSFKGRRSSKTDGGLDGGIHESFQIDSRVEKLDGQWKLRVKDVAARDVGALQGWSVTASKNQCDGQTQWATRTTRTTRRR
jgi:subtilisin-like proprotein convertase family protein